MKDPTPPSCLGCQFRADRPFCRMATEALEEFDAIKSLSTEPKGAALILEGQPSKKVLVLCEGYAKLSVCSATGKRLMIRIVGPGELLGLGAALDGTPYEASVELLDDAKVVWIRRKDLLKFLRRHPDVCMTVLKLLSQDLHVTYQRVRSIVLSQRRKLRVTRLGPPLR